MPVPKKPKRPAKYNKSTISEKRHCKEILAKLDGRVTGRYALLVQRKLRNLGHEKTLTYIRKVRNGYIFDVSVINVFKELMETDELELFQNEKSDKELV